jgi:hypothetical protein
VVLLATMIMNSVLCPPGLKISLSELIIDIKGYTCEERRVRMWKI